MSKKLNREIKCIDPFQGHNKRQGFSHYTDRDIRSNVVFAPNQCSIHVPMVQCPSSVPRPQCSNIFSETAWRIKAKFYVEPPWIGQMKVCSRHLGHMTKMAATPIYGKDPSKIFFSRTGRLIFTKLGM